MSILDISTRLHGHWSTFGKPLACPPIIVTSPGFGAWLSSGTYCLIASLSSSSWPSAVAPGYSRICDVVSVCSCTLKSDIVSCKCALGFIRYLLSVGIQGVELLNVISIRRLAWRWYGPAAEPLLTKPRFLFRKPADKEFCSAVPLRKADYLSIRR
jgi:hypothetical protein